MLRVGDLHPAHTTKYKDVKNNKLIYKDPTLWEDLIIKILISLNYSLNYFPFKIKYSKSFKVRDYLQANQETKNKKPTYFKRENYKTNRI